MRRRRILIFLTALLAVPILCALTLPWWLGAALRLAPEKLGVRFARYERVGYGRFALHDAEYRRGNVHVTATRIEADSPIVWLWHRSTSGAGEIVAEKWSVVVEPSPPSAANAAPASSRIDGWVPLRATLRRVAAQLDRWLPRAKVGAGQVKWPGGELAVGAATWQRRTLEVKRFAFRALALDGTVEFPADADELRVRAQTADGKATLKNVGAEIAGEVVWWDQLATVSGRYGEHGWFPAQATLQANAWNLPANKLKLGDAYASVRGRGRVDWSAQEFRADVEVRGEPLEKKQAPPLEATLRGYGDLKSFTVESLHATLPGMVADLSAPVTLDREGKFAQGGAKFTLQADLAKQPWFEAKGSVAGEAQLAAGVAQMPVVNFRVQARDLAAEGVAAASVEANGRLAWPRVEIANAVIVGLGGERLTAHGGWDYQAKEILDAAVEGELRRATLARWLPAQPQFEKIALKVQASGAIGEAKHSGEVRAPEMAFPGVKPLAVTAHWNGTGGKIDALHAEATAAATRLVVEAAIDREGVKLNALDLTQHNETRLKLKQPAAIRWRPAWKIEGLRLAGAEATIDADVAWGETGSAAIAIKNIPSAWLADLVTLPGPAWQIQSTALTGSWDRGPMNFSAVVGAGIELGDNRRAVVNLAGRGDQHGVRLEALRAAEGAASIVNASGTIPVTFAPGTTEPLRVDERAPLQIDADTAPNAAFWQELAALTGLELQEPHASVHLKGTWARPEGEVQLKVARIAADAKRIKRALPTIEALQVAVAGDRAGLRLDTLTFRVEGQEVKAAGKLPIAEADWTRVWKEPLALARGGADLRFEIPDADVAVFARFLPLYLAPKGRLHVDVGYKGGALDGSLRLSGAATRPLGPLGVLQEVEADLRLVGNAIEVRSVTAKSGGEDVKLSGRLELPEFKPGEAMPLPKFDLALQGANLPFVRSSGLLMRGDLDLKLTTPDRGAPRLSGNVKLRDSLFLQDVRALRPGGVHSVSRRPPYFSIDTPPLNTWRLDVNVTGEEFLRVRTTIFNGTASARFHLGGTLAEPVAIGEATITEGRVRLPFASFEVQEGRVSLTREQPYEPQLWVAATTRRFNYDLRMEVSGSANTPTVTFSSSPPLEHSQILLMVMTGDAPSTDIAVSDQQRARRLGTFIGASLFAGLGDADSAERLVITTGEKISVDGKETMQVEFKLTPRWALTADLPDEFGDKNAGVKWRAYTKGGREDATAGKTHESDQK